MRNNIAHENGTAAIEFAVIAPVMFFSLLGACYLALASYQAAALRYTAASGLRWAVLGKTETGYSREQSIERKIIQIGESLNLDLDENGIRICPAVSPNCMADDAGLGDQYIIISISREFPFFSPIVSSLKLSATVSGKNEPTV